MKMTPFPPGPFSLGANPQIVFKEVRAAVSSVSALDRTRIEVVRSSSLNPVDGMKRNVERLDSIQTSFQEAVEVTSGETHSTELRCIRDRRGGGSLLPVRKRKWCTNEMSILSMHYRRALHLRETTHGSSFP
ncbi:hypothetical protein F2P79_013324 [Pimephales promelas]|nr:hypothetical protein F2P79_013324 [Pimephales promelas]